MMPQLDPFYYANTSVSSFILLILSVYILSKYVLPSITRLFVTRLYIKKII